MSGLHVINGTDSSDQIQIRHLLGLIVESITKRPFHDALHRLIFDALGMQSAYMEGYSEPMTASGLPPAATLETMLSDDSPSMPAMRYGYAIWKFVTVPILAPAKFNCWGCE